MANHQAARTAIELFLEYPHLEAHHTLDVRKFEWLNAHKMVSFCEAAVEFESFDVNRNYAVRMSTIFQQGFQYLIDYANNRCELLPNEVKDSLQCLLLYFDQKDEHLKCLAPFMERVNDTVEEKSEQSMLEVQYTFLLAEHLFSPLIPGNGYLLDKKHFPRRLTTCPGGCNAQKPTCISTKKLTHTGMGHSEVWHGYIDIYLESGVSVNVSNSKNNVITHDTIDDDDDDDDEDDGGDYLICDRGKRRRLQEPDNWLPFNSAVEVKRGTSTVAETAAQAIVNAFLQKKNSLLIPSLCSSYGRLKVYMYDPDNDIFLMSPPNQTLDLFDYKKKQFLSDINIIYLWMILNYRICIKPQDKLITDVQSKNLTAGFDKFAKDKVNVYKTKLQIGVKSFVDDLDKEETPVVKIYIGI